MLTRIVFFGLFVSLSNPALACSKMFFADALESQPTPSLWERATRPIKSAAVKAFVFAWQRLEARQKRLLNQQNTDRQKELARTLHPQILEWWSSHPGLYEVANLKKRSTLEEIALDVRYLLIRLSKNLDAIVGDEYLEIESRGDVRFVLDRQTRQVDLDIKGAALSESERAAESFNLRAQIYYLAQTGAVKLSRGEGWTPIDAYLYGRISRWLARDIIAGLIDVPGYKLTEIETQELALIRSNE